MQTQEIFHAPKLKRTIQRWMRSFEKPLPINGYAPSPIESPALDNLSDAELGELNSILNWNCFTVDGHGRRFGNRAQRGKRETPQPIPDPRIELWDQKVGLRGRTALEIGCFEGVHTVGLCRLGATVTAVDSRTDHVVKTLVRASFYGTSPTVFLSDVEGSPLDARLPNVDLCFHCGVLYHLKDPVTHLTELLPRVQKSILLDTHYAEESKLTESYEVSGKNYPYQRYAEGGKENNFAGMYDHAKWLSLKTLTELLSDSGFTELKEVKTREERNGARVLIIASRP